MATTVGLGILLALVVLVILIWVFGARARSRLAAAYPPPGRMVDVGGYRLHILCSGEGAPGAPAVVMVSGNADSCLTWSLVQPEIAKFAPVCSYDRAGLGWSELGPKQPTAADVVADLHSLLEKAGVQPPYVLVGHSIGGLFARLYAHEYPEQVAGMVLVDSSHEEQDIRFPESLQKLTRSSNAMMGAVIGLLKLLNRWGLLPLLAGRMGWPTPAPKETQRMNMGIICANGTFFEAATRESLAVEQNLAAVRAAAIKSLGDIPLVVLSAGKLPVQAGPGMPAEDVERLKVLSSEFAAELAALSPQGKRVLAEKSGHYIHVEQPNLVVDAVREVVAACRIPQVA